MKSNETLLVIPYVRDGAQGWELDTAVRGWRKNWRGGALRIVVVGDSTPVTESLRKEGLIESMLLPRAAEHVGEPELGRVAAMAWILSYYGGTYDGCIWSDDDIYPVNPFEMRDVKARKGLGTLTGNPDSANWFHRAMFRTRTALEAAGLPTVNYSSHCPRWYDFETLEEVLDRFGCARTPHLVESLYFNVRYPKGASGVANVNRAGNRFKFGIYDGSVTPAVLQEAMSSGVLWVNNSPAGYDRKLLDLVRAFIMNNTQTTNQ